MHRIAKMMPNWFCMRSRQSRAWTVRTSQRTAMKRGTVHPQSANTTADDLLVAGLFNPLKTKTDLFDCFKKEGAKIDDVYCMLKRIGRGGFSEVWLATYRNKPKEDAMAIKLMPKNLVSSADVVNEIAVLKTTHNCPFVVQMTTKFHTPTHYAIVMKYATGGTLNDRVKMVRRFSELVARFYAAEIAEGLFGLHSRGIVHRDLNLDNVLIGDNGHAILSDFGLSLLRDPEDMNGTFEPWADATKAQIPAPELLLGLRYNKTVDWWAYGVMLYRMVCGEYPFTRKGNHGRLQDCSLEDIYHKEVYPSYLSYHIKALLEQLLARRCSHRLGRGSFEENDVNSMEFFFNVDWGQLRDHMLPAPFSDLVPYSQQKSKKHCTVNLPVTHMASVSPNVHSKALA